MTTDRELYEEMYARQLAEGHDLETAMRFNKAATPEDFRRAFGTSDDPRQQWRKIGGGNKGGSRGAGHKSSTSSSGPTVSSIMSSRGLSPSFGANIK